MSDKVVEDKNNLSLKNNSIPFLKHRFYKSSKLVRFLSNYGASVTEDTKYFFKAPTCTELIEEQKETDQNVLKQSDIKSKKKKKLWNFLYFIINIAVIAITLTLQLSSEEDPSASLSVIFDANWWFILAAFGVFAAGMFLDQIRFLELIRKATGVFRFNLAYKVSAQGKYYDVITPLSTGGQPFQVLYLNRYGVKAGQGISIVMAKYIFYQIVYFIGASYFLFRSTFFTDITTSNSLFLSGTALTFSWIGYICIAVVIFLVGFISLNKRAGAGFVVGILKLLSKIKIGKFRLIKDYKKSFQSVMRTVNTWQRTTKQYSKSAWIIIVNVICSVLYFLLNYSMLFFIYCAFEGWHPEMWLEIMSMGVLVDLASAFNPLPMGTGTAELSFSALIAVLFSSNGAAVWALIIWRILYNYSYIIQGFLLISYDYVIGNRRLEKNKEFWLHPVRERIKIKREQFFNSKKNK